MKPCCCSRTFVLVVYAILLGLVNCSPPINVPPCHPGMFKYFGWCEQSDCEDKCSCMSSKSVCKQICSHLACNLLYCFTQKNCFQRVLLSDYKSVPRVSKMISSSPIIQQDCSNGRCDLVKAMRYENRFTRTFQSCSGGHCGDVHSEADHTKQFCGNCDRMRCDGKHAVNCTQLCIIGKCKRVYCNAKRCKQMCAHDSVCNLTCGEDTEECVQTCSHGSTCEMNCSARMCKQVCDKHKSCVKNRFPNPANNKTISSTSSTITSTASVTSPTAAPSTSSKSSTSTRMSTSSTTYSTLPKLFTTSTSTSTTPSPADTELINTTISATYTTRAIPTWRLPTTNIVEIPSSSSKLTFSCTLPILCLVFLRFLL